MNNNNNKVQRGDIFYYNFGVKEGSIAYGGYKRPPVRRRTAAVRCQRPECKPYLI